MLEIVSSDQRKFDYVSANDGPTLIYNKWQKQMYSRDKIHVKESENLNISWTILYKQVTGKLTRPTYLSIWFR